MTRSSRHLSIRTAAPVAVLIIIGALITGTTRAEASEIVVSTTIQSAVDSAQPGDTVVIPAGVYRESVLIRTAGVTLRAEPGAVLDGAGLDARFGLQVRAPTGSRLAGFTLIGLQVQNYDFTGVFLSGVDDFRLTGTTYVDNAEYGVFPVRCSHGRVDHNTVSGSQDSGVYVGQCSDVLVDHNVAHANTVGIEVELSSRIQLLDNLSTDNAIGAVVQIVPGLATTVTEDVLVHGNVLSGNARPNPVDDPDELLSLLPGGVGIVNVAGDRVRIEGNTVSGNPSVGIGIVGLPPEVAALDPRLDPSPDGGIVRGNVTSGNGRDPDPELAPRPAVDVLWDGSGTTCFQLSRSARRFPNPLPGC